MSNRRNLTHIIFHSPKFSHRVRNDLINNRDLSAEIDFLETEDRIKTLFREYRQELQYKYSDTVIENGPEHRQLLVELGYPQENIGEISEYNKETQTSLENK